METIDPDKVFVEDHQYERAMSFAEEDPTLAFLSEEDRQKAAHALARMMTALNIELMMESSGASCVKSIDLVVDEINEKTIVVFSSRLDRGVEHEAVVLDKAQAYQILGYT